MHQPYPWPEGKRAAFVFSMDVDSDSPWAWINRDRSGPLYLSHLEQRRFGLREGIWRVLDLLERFDIRGSFYVPGSVAEAHPYLLPKLIAGGHEVGLHGWFHEFVTEISDAEFSEALERSLDLFHRQTGLRPRGFRSPAWEMTPHMLAEVQRLGLYDSSLSGFDHPYQIGGVTEIPVQWAMDDAVYWKFLGGGGDLAPPFAPAQVLEIWQQEWRGLQDFGGLLMLTVHDYITPRAHRLKVLETLLAEVRETPGAWIARASDLADWHNSLSEKHHWQASPTAPAGP